MHRVTARIRLGYVPDQQSPQIAGIDATARRITLTLLLRDLLAKQRATPSSTDSSVARGKVDELSSASHGRHLKGSLLRPVS